MTVIQAYLLLGGLQNIVTKSWNMFARFAGNDLTLAGRFEVTCPANTTLPRTLFVHTAATGLAIRRASKFTFRQYMIGSSASCVRFVMLIFLASNYYKVIWRRTIRTEELILPRLIVTHHDIVINFCLDWLRYNQNVQTVRWEEHLPTWCTFYQFNSFWKFFI